MHLWNWLLPPLFGWRTLGFWQALGLLALCRILFGGLGGHGPGSQSGTRASGTVQEDESGGAGEVSPGDGGGLRLRNVGSGVLKEVKGNGKYIGGGGGRWKGLNL